MSVVKIHYGSEEIASLDSNTPKIKLNTTDTVCNQDITIALNYDAYNYEYDTPEYENYVCFTAAQSASILSIDYTAGWTHLEYSYDKLNWTLCPLNQTTTITLANIGDQVYLRGTNTTLSTSSYAPISGGIFNITGQMDVSGNINTLLSYDTDVYDLSGRDYCFTNLFAYAAGLRRVNLVLPALILAPYCYSYMFNHSGITMANIILPAETILQGAYLNMFSYCTNLIQAPNLTQATTVRIDGCSDIFNGCSSLTTAPKLNFITISDRGCCRMFYNCTALVTVPILHARYITTDGCMNFVSGCTALYVADAPVSNIAECVWTIPADGVGGISNVQTSMFKNCLGTRASDSPNFYDVQKIYYTQNPPV